MLVYVKLRKTVGGLSSVVYDRLSENCRITSIIAKRPILKCRVASDRNQMGICRGMVDMVDTVGIPSI